jgi:post-segregation antitoxin (ccd killing protein)
MGKERLTVEVDQELTARLRAAGVDPIQYVERLLVQQAAERETPDERDEREATLRAEMRHGLDAYDRLIEEAGDWSANLRTF